jgi:hypothetical protein
MWSSQAEAEGLTLLKADNKAGYFGVHLPNPGHPKPYRAQVTRGGKDVHLGSFATAEEAALCVARSPEGQAAAERAAAPAPLTSEEARQQAQAEGLTLLKADNKAGYFGVHLHNPGTPKPYRAQVTRGGKEGYLGCFATAEEAALRIARSPEGRAAAAAERPAAPAPLTSEERPAAPAPLTSEEARQQARVEGLTLFKADTKAGYFGVCHQPGRSKPYQARVWRGGKEVYLGTFATAEEAALCVARSPEGRAAAAAQAAAGRAAPAPQPPASEEGNGTAPAMPPGAVLKEEGAVPPMPPGAFVKEEQVAPPMPPGAFFKEEGVVPPMPSDAVAKREHAVVVKEEERSDGRPKRRRSK